MADEKERDRRQTNRRRVLWQTYIFLIAVTINLLVTFRERFILDQAELYPDSDIRLATNLCRGIGYIVIGNLYDNVPRPKRLTFWVLMMLALCTSLGAIPSEGGDLMSEELKDIDDQQIINF
jgi:hypothetical protein